jgi:hypothetical protein
MASTDSTTTTDDESNPDTRQFILLGETQYGPYRNYTRLGIPAEVAPENFDSEEELRKEAAKRAVATMPESKSEIVDDELMLVEISNETTFLALEDL